MVICGNGRHQQPPLAPFSVIWNTIWFHRHTLGSCSGHFIFPLSTILNTYCSVVYLTFFKLNWAVVKIIVLSWSVSNFFWRWDNVTKFKFKADLRWEIKAIITLLSKNMFCSLVWLKQRGSSQTLRFSLRLPSTKLPLDGSRQSPRVLCTSNFLWGIVDVSKKQIWKKKQYYSSCWCMTVQLPSNVSILCLECQLKKAVVLQATQTIILKKYLPCYSHRPSCSCNKQYKKAQISPLTSALEW